jgi:hypothetical protein
MPQLSQAASRVIFFGGFAVALTLGAVQFAMGRDLGRDLVGVAAEPAGTTEATINRAAKADRAAGIAGPGIQTQTISLRSHGLPDTSVLVRIPLAQARSNSSAPLGTKPSGRTLACETSVSVLTEVARHLAPGRCVT